MAITAKVLAEGQLPNTKGTLYTVPGAKTAYIKFFRLTNSSGIASESGAIFANVSGTSRLLGHFLLPANNATDVIDKDAAMNLGAGGTIEGYASDAATVDYVITGAEE